MQVVPHYICDKCGFESRDRGQTEVCEAQPLTPKYTVGQQVRMRVGVACWKGRPKGHLPKQGSWVPATVLEVIVQRRTHRILGYYLQHESWKTRGLPDADIRPAK